MLLKDQIPSFPEMTSFGVLLQYVAHGTTDHNAIHEKYHSRAESQYAEDLTFEKIVNLLRDGKIRATGRASTVKKGLAKRWQGQQFRNHSKLRTYVEAEFWNDFIFQQTSWYGIARNQHKEYADIKLVLDDCRTQLADDIEAHKKEEKHDAPKARLSEYSTPYIELMWRAIDEFEISEGHQPVKKALVEWFLAQDVAGQKISAVAAEYLATFVRLPSSQSGGNRPWKVRAQSQQAVDQ